MAAVYNIKHSQNCVQFTVFTARRYASVVYAMALCLSQVGVLSKQLNIGSNKQHHTITQGI